MDIDTEIAAYFINNTTVDCPYILTEHQSQILQRKLEVYNELTLNFPTSLGKKASRDERENLKKMRESSLTYGEIDFVSIGEIFYTIQERYGDLPQGGIFYDLGSGIGKAILAAALLGNFSECRGIEILSGLHEIALKLIDEYNNNFTGHVLKNSDLWTVMPRLRSIKGDVCQDDWSDAAFIFVNSTCFSEEMMAFISGVPVPVGTFAVSLTRPLHATSWAQLETVVKKMSWGEATIYIQRKVSPEEQQKAMYEFGKALDS
jgi:Histone methylation protein DOT1